MQLTRKAEYAIRAMVDLATNYHRQPVMSKDIAARQDIPEKFLVQIIPDLKNTGLIHTVRGNSGGIYLGKRPPEINLRQIVEAIEGPIAINHCLAGDDSCSRRPGCAIYKVWQKAQGQMLAVLESTSLATLAVSKMPPAEAQMPEGAGRVSNEIEIDV